MTGHLEPSLGARTTIVIRDGLLACGCQHWAFKLCHYRVRTSVFAHHAFRLAGLPDPDVEVAATHLHR
jgi:hypothetical protein